MFLALLLTLSEPDPGMARQSRPELTPGDPLPRYIQLLPPGSTGHSKPFPVTEHFRDFFL